MQCTCYIANCTTYWIRRLKRLKLINKITGPPYTRRCFCIYNVYYTLPIFVLTLETVYNLKLDLSDSLWIKFNQLNQPLTPESGVAKLANRLTNFCFFLQISKNKINFNLSKCPSRCLAKQRGDLSLILKINSLFFCDSSSVSCCDCPSSMSNLFKFKLLKTR